MPKKLTILVLLLFLHSFSAALCASELAEHSFELEHGPYPVGFRVEHHYDLGRSFPRELTDAEADAVNRGARPLQISIWYPAGSADAGSTMTVADYLSYRASELDFSATSTADAEAELNRLKDRITRTGKSAEELEAILSGTVLARRDARVAKGQFPLLLYAPSFNASPSEQFILCEYLASHGFIVASSPCVGTYTRNQTNNIMGYDVVVEDMQFVLSKLLTDPAVNPDKVGAFGFSWGGWSSIMLTMKDDRIKAVADFDGQSGFVLDDVNRRMVDYMPAQYPKLMTTPLLELQGMGKPGGSGEPRHEKLYFQGYYNEAYMVHFKQLIHFYFSVQYILFDKFVDPQLSESERQMLTTSYNAICRYSLNFFAAYLQESEAAQAFLNASIAENGYPDELMDRYARTAEALPLTGDDLVAFIRSEGVDAGLALIHKTHERMPEFKMFGNRTMLDLASEFWRDGDQDGAQKLHAAGVKAFPEDHRNRFFLAETLRVMGHTEEARKHYQKAIELGTHYPADKGLARLDEQ